MIGFGTAFTMPLANMIVTSRVIGGYAFNVDVFLNANIGGGTTRLVIDPGFGFSALSTDAGSAGTIRLPAQIGRFETHFNLAVSLAGQGKLEAAFAEATAELEVNPGHTPARKLQEELRRKLHR